MAPFPQTTLPAHVRAPQGGRPTEYRLEYSQAVIDFMAQGFSLTRCQRYGLRVDQGASAVFRRCG
jgi:hypothetical protein